MRVMLNFKCTNNECNHIEEKFVDSKTKEVSCTVCNSVANKMLCAPKVKGNTTGSSPSYSKFKY